MNPLAPLTTLRTREEGVLRYLDEATSALNDDNSTAAVRILTQAVYSLKPTETVRRECRSVLAAVEGME